MANRIVSVHAGIYGRGIYAIMLPSSGFSVAHRPLKNCRDDCNIIQNTLQQTCHLLSGFIFCNSSGLLY